MVEENLSSFWSLNENIHTGSPLIKLEDEKIILTLLLLCGSRFEI